LVFRTNDISKLWYLFEIWKFDGRKFGVRKFGIRKNNVAPFLTAALSSSQLTSFQHEIDLKEGPRKVCRRTFQVTPCCDPFHKNTSYVHACVLRPKSCPVSQNNMWVYVYIVFTNMWLSNTYHGDKKPICTQRTLVYVASHLQHNYLPT
jgi:hypothetical protein